MLTMIDRPELTDGGEVSWCFPISGGRKQNYLSLGGWSLVLDR